MSALTAVWEDEAEGWTLRMKDLCQATGISRQVVHFYIQQGLLPAGKKTGQNMAYYSQEHVRRIELIRKLQEERFLPLKAIKALFDEQETSFTPSQRGFLRTLRSSILEDEVTEVQSFASADDLASRFDIEPRDIEELISEGLIHPQSADGEGLRLRPTDLEWIEILANLRQVGLTRELGFQVGDLRGFGDSMNALIRWEVDLITKRLSILNADDAGQRIRHALPVVHQLIAHIHQSKIEDLLSAL